ESDIPLNAGVLDPLEVVLPECFLNPPAASDPAECAAVSAGNVETSQRIVDAIFGALGTVAASQGTMNNLLFGNEDFGYYETIAGGAGAGAGFAGADGVHTHMTNTRITDPEVLERRYPVRLHRFCLRRGSGGAGENRGGDGIVREIEFLDQVEVSILSQRRSRGPYGMAGGEAGEPGRNLLRRAGEAGWKELPAVTTFSTRAGDRLRIETPGGGGWGSPSGQA
ncbi:MAG: hydantoinase B/oxoprolinase family protein, partial [Planctomycetota bacterium]|nr:hydantoinase B/oxoprolinase family protein [Planctomycetota bacterium]